MEHPTFGAVSRPQAGPFGRGATGAEPSPAPKETSGPGVADLVDRLFERFEQLEYTVIDHMPSSDDRAGDQEAIMDRLAAIEQRLAGLEEAGFRDGLARIEAAQVRQAEAIEALGHALAERTGPDLGPLRAEIADGLARLDASMAESPGWADNILETVARSGRVESGEELQVLIGELGARIDRLADRPVPAPDLTEQRQSQAMFMAAGKAFLKRLEALVGGLASEHLRLLEKVETAQTDSGDPKVAELAQVVAALSDATARLAGFATSASSALAPDQRDVIDDLRVTVAELLADGHGTARQNDPGSA